MPFNTQRQYAYEASRSNPGIGMAGFVLKKHARSTVCLAAEAAKRHPGLAHHWRDGSQPSGRWFRPGARRTRAGRWGAGHLDADSGRLGRRKASRRFARSTRHRPGTGHQPPQLQQIPEVIADADAVLSTGHVSAEELSLRTARLAGVGHLTAPPIAIQLARA